MTENAPPSFDIIIIGAGNAGLTLAAVLPDTTRIAIIDHKDKPSISEPKIDGRKIALNYGSKLILDKFNLWQTLEPHVTPITQVHVSQQGHFGITRLTAVENNTPALGYVISAEMLMRSLQEQADTHDNITWLYSTKLIGLEKNSIKVEHDSLEKILTAKLIIVADGTQSYCRKLLDIETDITEYGQSALITRVKLKYPHCNIAYERFLKNGTLALLPMQDNYYGVVWMASPEEIANLKNLSDTELLAQIQENFGYRLGKFTAVDASITYPIRSIIAAEQIKNNCLLLGDAAHHTSPVAAQGFNSTLQDIYCLVNLLNAPSSATFGVDFSLKGEVKKILIQYESERLPEQQKIISSVDKLMENFKSSHFPLPQLRSLALTFLDLTPENKKNLSSLFMGLTPRIQKLLRKQHVAKQ
jgi:ubiquinone biosynthesis UbiH/UbiF/VisC/COQ6 family hydroxylase